MFVGIFCLQKCVEEKTARGCEFFLDCWDGRKFFIFVFVRPGGGRTFHVTHVAKLKVVAWFLFQSYLE